jgi:hypothetical protein
MHLINSKNNNNNNNNSNSRSTRVFFTILNARFKRSVSTSYQYYILHSATQQQQLFTHTHATHKFNVRGHSPTTYTTVTYCNHAIHQRTSFSTITFAYQCFSSNFIILTQIQCQIKHITHIFERYEHQIILAD